MRGEEVHRNSGSRSSDTSKRCMAVFSCRFFPSFFPARHVLPCRAANTRNAGTNKGRDAFADSGQVIPEGCHAPDEAWERKCTARIDIILTFIRAAWTRRERVGREIRKPLLVAGRGPLRAIIEILCQREVCSLLRNKIRWMIIDIAFTRWENLDFRFAEVLSCWRRILTLFLATINMLF